MTERAAMRARLRGSFCDEHGFAWPHGAGDATYALHIGSVIRGIEELKAKGAAGEPSRATAAPKEVNHA